jgi:quercetin dioxygenase-like cupin family protein
VDNRIPGRLGRNYLDLKMLENKTFHLHDAERVTVRTLTPELLEVAAEWDPADHRPPPHLHASQDETFTIEAGALTYELDGGPAQTLTAGDVLEIPRGTPHRMWNAGDEQARGLWQTRPALRTAEFWQEMDAARQTRPTNHGGLLTPVAIAPLLRKYRAEFQLALPAPLERTALAVLGAAARVKGYR